MSVPPPGAAPMAYAPPPGYDASPSGAAPPAFGVPPPTNYMGPEGQPLMMAVPVAAPPVQVMVDNSGNPEAELHRLLSAVKGLGLRQKLDLLEAFVPMYEKRNKYKAAMLPDDLITNDDPETWNDKTFKKLLKVNKLFGLKEESECFQRICCGPWREFKMKVQTSKKRGGVKMELAEFDRPFSCCVCDQRIDTKLANGKHIGSTKYDFRCTSECMGKRHWKISDGDGQVKYVLRQDICCNANACAPTFCCPAHRMEILNAEETEEVGSLTNFFPGCTTRGCFGTADNYKLVFPADADPAMKMQLMATTILLDYMLFEKQEDNRNSHDAGGY